MSRAGTGAAAGCGSTPRLETDRLILRKFTERDLGAVYTIFSDVEVNTFLPWFPVKSMAEAEAFYETRIAGRYRQAQAYYYAVCRREDDLPIGYVTVNPEDGFDLGYGLRREFWHRGLMTEAGRAVLERLQQDGIPFVTATHDVRNPRSGDVMKRLHMQYRYSYEEQWQPKDLRVTFRLYQRNLDGRHDRVYTEYWDRSAVRFVEPEV